MSNRVFITGAGTVTSLGIGAEATWNGLISGKSGAAPITLFDCEGYKTKFACEVKNFTPTDYIDRKDAKRMDRFCQLAMASSVEAMDQAAFDFDKLDQDRVGVVYASGIGGMLTYQQQVIKLHNGGPGKVSPFFVPMMIGDIVSGQISIRWGLRGPNYNVQSACASSSHSIGIALMHLRAGDADVMVTGGSEAPICETGVAGFNALHALSTRNDEPERASRPFDKERDGFILGEGAVSFVLETEEHARARGAELLAEVTGYGFSGDAFHLTAPAPEGAGAVRSMSEALRSSGIKAGDVDYLNAHGTSTELNDKNETMAIKTVFGDHVNNLAISSTKSMTGHMLGAAGAMEAFVCMKALQTGIVPPTINYENPDPDCDLNYTPNVAVKKDLSYAMSNTFGFGGHNATLALRKV
jgi:3-oxoacyl-[acyl-carrier-protein] synthase II